MVSSMALLGFALLQILTCLASPAPTHSIEHDVPPSTRATPSTTAYALPNASLINIQRRAADSSSVSSYSGNMLITYAPITTTDSNGALTTISASTPAGQGAHPTPYPPPPAPPPSASVGKKAVIGAASVVGGIFLLMFICCVCAQRRRRNSVRRQNADGQVPGASSGMFGIFSPGIGKSSNNGMEGKDGNMLKDLKPIPAGVDHKQTTVVDEARQPSPADPSFAPDHPNQPSAEPFQTGLPVQINRFPSHHSTRGAGNTNGPPNFLQKG